MRSRRSRAVAVAAVLLAVGLSGCGGNAGTPSAGGPSGGNSAPTTATSQAQITSSVADGATSVRINRSVRLDVSGGTLTDVSVTGNGGALKGVLSADKTSWQSTGRLQPGWAYRVHGVAVDDSGARAVYSGRFHTETLPLSRQTFPSFFPLPGATVGIAMPVVIRFDVPVTDHASIQRHLKVTSVPAQPGGFHWISDTEVHWRPEHFWQPNTKVTVNADIDSIPAGNGIYGQKSRVSTFTIGRAQIIRVDTRTDQLRVFRGGALIRTIPITTGQQPEFTTRSGIKVIVEKDRRQNMNSETIGIDPNGPNGYNLKGVEFAMRLTYSGEFLHAAPWSVASQGHANVSHGCTGMSRDNAEWLYTNSIIGDPAVYTGTDRPMTLSNGLGDWNLPFAQYVQP